MKYYHVTLPPVLAKPGCGKVIPLAPTFISPQDGAQQQDCELNAVKRWLVALGEECARLKAIILGDVLYCQEPFSRSVQPQAQSFTVDFDIYGMNYAAASTLWSINTRFLLTLHSLCAHSFVPD